MLRVDEKHLREYYVLNVCGVIITTNHKTDGIYLPADDRRHFVAWSDLTKDDFAAILDASSGAGTATAATATSPPISPARPLRLRPQGTAAEDRRLLGHRRRQPRAEDAELADALDELGQPDVVTLDRVAQPTAAAAFADWLRDRKNRRRIPHRFEDCGYAAVRNPDADDGLWKIGAARQAVYGRRDFDRRTLIAHARALAANG